MGLSEEAIETLNTLLTIYPNSIDGLMVKIFVLLEKENFSQARTCLDKVLKLDPDNEVALEIKEDLINKEDY